jgi:hypothetical protein
LGGKGDYHDNIGEVVGFGKNCGFGSYAGTSSLMKLPKQSPEYSP